MKVFASETNKAQRVSLTQSDVTMSDLPWNTDLDSIFYTDKIGVSVQLNG